MLFFILCGIQLLLYLYIYCRVNIVIFVLFSFEIGEWWCRFYYPHTISSQKADNEIVVEQTCENMRNDFQRTFQCFHSILVYIFFCCSSNCHIQNSRIDESDTFEWTDSAVWFVLSIRYKHISKCENTHWCRIPTSVKHMRTNIVSLFLFPVKKGI